MFDMRIVAMVKAQGNLEGAIGFDSNPVVFVPGWNQKSIMFF